MRLTTHAPLQLIWILTLLLAGGFAAQAEEETKEETESVEVIELSLREAVTLAISNNLGVEVERHAPLIAQQDVRIAWGAYDPVLAASATYSRDRTPNASPFSSSNSNKTFLTNGLTQVGGLIPYLGANLSLEYSGSRTKSNQGFAGLSPQFDAGLSFTANVPLLKNLVWNAPWTQIRVTNLVHSAALEDFRKVIMDTVRDTELAYWDLVALEEKLRVARKSLQTSQALREQTQTQYEVGVKAKVEVIQADAGVAGRELDVIFANANYHNSQDNLNNEVFGVRLAPNTIARIQPTDIPSDFEDYVVDPTIATELAMKNRPEIATLELDITRRETLVRFQKNQRLPQFDLNLAYGTSGLKGQTNPSAFVGGAPVPADRIGGFDDTHDDFFSKKGGRQFSIGGAFSIPLGNMGPRHKVSKARLELRRAKTQLTQLHQRIILEVRRDIRLLEAARMGIDASERQRVAAEEQLRAERIRLEHGESTPFDVLQKESDLVGAEVSKIQALQLYRTSASTLDRVQGTILRTHNIVVGSIAGL